MNNKEIILSIIFPMIIVSMIIGIISGYSWIWNANILLQGKIALSAAILFLVCNLWLGIIRSKTGVDSINDIINKDDE